MKRTFPLFVFVLLAGSLLSSRHAVAQAPEKMSYQAVIRDASDQLVTNQEIGLRVSILQSSIDGTVVYQEIYNPNPETNNNGLLTIEIGAGVPLTGTFSEIDWSDGPYFLKTETDPSGGTTYTITGTSQLLSVPYALHSGTAEILTGEITESQITDLQNYLTEEIDPIFSGSPASGIEVDDIDNWNEAYDITSGTLTVDRGGTGRSSLTSGRVLVGNGTSAVLMNEDLHWDNANARLGIGTTSPAALLHTSGTDTGGGNVLFVGEWKPTNPGDPPASGAGTRMIWYPDKAAFRAGRVLNENWDKDSIGIYSFATGHRTKAKGRGSIAMGDFTTASGWNSTAMGDFTTASGSASTAMGSSTTASGSASTAMGGSTTASGSFSTAMGIQTTASGVYSTAMGRYAKAEQDYSFAINLSSTTGPGVGANTFQISGASAIGGNTGWSEWSDKRLKKDIQDLGRENNLEKIIKLNGVRFRWIESNPDNDRFYLGFLAQDVLDILPEPVLHDELNDIYSMEYTALIPVLVEAIKEQQEQIEELKERDRKIARLKEENTLLRSSLIRLEQMVADIELWKKLIQADIVE